MTADDWEHVAGRRHTVRGQDVPSWVRFRMGRLAHATERVNLRLPTLGGKQMWADRFVYAEHRIQQNILTGHCRLLGPGDVRLAWGDYESCRAEFEELRESKGLRPTGEHLVLLLHGIFRSKDAMGPMERAFRAQGFETAAINYPSTLSGIDEHAAQLRGLLNRAEGVNKVSLVGHSMGGLVIRALLRDGGPWTDRLALQRVVTIATPNRGAFLAQGLNRVWAFRMAAGPACDQLLSAYVGDLPEPPCEFGTIAGVRGNGRGYNPLIPGEDDFTVAHSSTHLPGAADTLDVVALHTFIMQTPEVIEASLRFVQTGRFKG